MEPFMAGNEVTVLEHVAARIEGKRAELVKLDEKPPMPVADAMRAYLESPDRTDASEGTLHVYQSQFRTFLTWIESKLPNATMTDVTPELAREFAGELIRQGKAPGTWNSCMNFLRLLFRVLKSEAGLTQNPWDGIPRKRMMRESRRELTVEELRKVCDAAEGEMRLLLGLGIYTGLRMGDCCTLRWAEVDLHRGVIRRIPNKSARRRNKPVVIPIHPTLGAMLVDAPSREQNEYILPEMAYRYPRGTNQIAPLVQSHFKACGIRVHKPGTGFEIITDKDGKKRKVHTGKRAVVEVGFHSLRHTFVSMCRNAGAPLSVVAAIVGHATPAMTRYYTHVGEEASSAAIAALPAVLGDEPRALPASKPQSVERAAVLKLAESLTSENWRTIRDELLELAG